MKTFNFNVFFVISSLLCLGRCQGNPEQQEPLTAEKRIQQFHDTLEYLSNALDPSVQVIENLNELDKIRKLTILSDEMRSNAVNSKLANSISQKKFIHFQMNIRVMYHFLHNMVLKPSSVYRPQDLFIYKYEHEYDKSSANGLYLIFTQPESMTVSDNLLYLTRIHFRNHYRKIQASFIHYYALFVQGCLIESAYRTVSNQEHFDTSRKECYEMGIKLKENINEVEKEARNQWKTQYVIDVFYYVAMNYNPEKTEEMKDHIIKLLQDKYDYRKWFVFGLADANPAFLECENARGFAIHKQFFFLVNKDMTNPQPKLMDSMNQMVFEKYYEDSNAYWTDIFKTPYANSKEYIKIMEKGGKFCKSASLAVVHWVPANDKTHIGTTRNPHFKYHSFYGYVTYNKYRINLIF